MPSINSRQRTTLKRAGLLLDRLAVGGLFFVFAIGKAMHPLGEFHGDIMAYQLVPEMLVPAFAFVVVYTELFLGTFLVLGLFEKKAAIGIGGLLIMFVIAILQAGARGIALEDCGCSGGLITLGETPFEVVLRDVIMLIGVVWIVRAKDVSLFALDSLFNKKSS